VAFEYVPECGAPYSGVDLVCTVQDFVSLPDTSLTEVYLYGLNLYFSLLPYALPVLIAGVCVSLVLSQIWHKS